MTDLFSSLSLVSAMALPLSVNRIVLQCRRHRAGAAFFFSAASRPPPFLLLLLHGCPRSNEAPPLSLVRSHKLPSSASAAVLARRQFVVLQQSHRCCLDQLPAPSILWSLSRFLYFSVQSKLFVSSCGNWTRQQPFSYLLVLPPSAIRSLISWGMGFKKC